MEWVQNNENEQWEEDEVNGKMRAKMVKAATAVLTKQKEINEGLDALEDERRKHGLNGKPLQPVDLRTAAYVLAIERVANVTLERGIWP